MKKPKVWPRVDGEISAPEVRVISHDGEQLGTMPLGEALARAKAQGLNLLEVSPRASPPICRIASFEEYQRLSLEKKDCDC